MSDYRPRFRLFLFTVNTLYLASQIWWHTAPGGPPAEAPTWWHQTLNWVMYALLNVAYFLQGLAYAGVVLGLEPLLAALSLGWLGGNSLRELADTPLAGRAYVQIALVLAVNTGLLTLIKPDLAGLLLHLLFCTGSLLLVYRRVFFNRCPATCRLARRWLVTLGR